MGKDKASLRIGGTTFLQRTCDIAAKVASPVVVVAGADQSVIEGGDGIVVVRDSVPFPGPLPALQLGCESLLAHVSEEDMAHRSVWVTGCDTPFVTAEIIRTLWQFQQQEGADAVTLTEDSRDNPLLAVYQLQALCRVKQFVESGRARATDFLQGLNVARLPVESLSLVDAPVPTTNLNTPDDLKSIFGDDQDTHPNRVE